MLTLLLALFLCALIVYFVVSIQGKILENHYIGLAPGEGRITVQGLGKVLAKPDVAETTVGVLTRGVSVVEAQQENTKTLNAIIDFLKKSGVEDKDVKTVNYSIQPRYDYSSFGKGKVLDYEVQNTLQVKIRDLQNAGRILQGVSEIGANEVGALQFVIDDPDKQQADARQKALEDAKKKAEAMANQLGAGLGRIVSFSESPSYFPPIYAAVGRGGVAESVPAPQLQPGENEIQITVNMTYEIR